MMVTKKLSTTLLTETLTKPMGKHKQSEPDNPEAAIDYLEAIAREAALLKTALESMLSITPATRKQIEVSVIILIATSEPSKPDIYTNQTLPDKHERNYTLPDGNLTRLVHEC